MDQRQEILAQAMALSAEDRAFIAIALEDSLSSTISEGDFLAELRRRSAAYRAGATTSRPAVELLADLRRRQTDEARA